MKISEYDLRQIRLMKVRIESAKRRTIPVASFVSDQWALVDLLTTVEPSWKETYLKAVNEVEQIYAMGVSDGSPKPSDSDMQAIDTILSRLESLLELLNLEGR